MTITLEDMVKGRSLSEEGAELLAGITASASSFIVHALPRNAGKSTLAGAILGAAPPGTVRRPFFGTEDEASDLLAHEPDGYLVVAEIGQAPMRGYLWGVEVRRLFDLVAHGYPLATCLHADSVGEVFRVLERNGIPASSAAEVTYLLKVTALGPTHDPRTRRVVEAVHRIGHDDGDIAPQLLYRYDREADRFEALRSAT